MGYRYTTPDAATVADERATLEAFLDHYRQAVINKTQGLSEEDARRRLVDSMTTIAGIVKHLRRVEVSWFQRRLAQTPVEQLPVLDVPDRPDSDFRLDSGETLGALVREYMTECDASRETAAHFQLEDTVPHPRLGRVSLRWVYVHMIEETARHAGHADILRELIDGRIGD